jgi:hypothetical protein
MIALADGAPTVHGLAIVDDVTYSRAEVVATDGGLA